MKMVTDRYTVRIPGDCADTVERLGDIAIEEARDRTRIYAIPASWEATLVSGELGDFEVTFLVKRRRNKPIK